MPTLIRPGAAPGDVPPARLIPRPTVILAAVAFGSLGAVDALTGWLNVPVAIPLIVVIVFGAVAAGLGFGLGRAQMVTLCRPPLPGESTRYVSVSQTARVPHTLREPAWTVSAGTPARLAPAPRPELPGAAR